MLERFVDWLLAVLLQLGYPGIIALMAMESSILPVPSELVMPPAGYWAAKGEMNFLVAVGCGVVGSIIGALANYYGAHWIGGPFLRRFGKYVFLTDGPWRARSASSPNMASSAPLWGGSSRWCGT